MDDWKLIENAFYEDFSPESFVFPKFGYWQPFAWRLWYVWVVPVVGLDESGYFAIQILLLAFTWAAAHGLIRLCGGPHAAGFFAAALTTIAAPTMQALSWYAMNAYLLGSLFQLSVIALCFVSVFAFETVCVPGVGSPRSRCWRTSSGWGGFFLTSMLLIIAYAWVNDRRRSGPVVGLCAVRVTALHRVVDF